MADYAVLGATSWGVTLAWLLTTNGHSVTLLVRDDAEAATVSSHRGIERLPEISLPHTASVATLANPGGGYAGLVAAVPAQAMRSTLHALAGLRETPVLSAAKGIEHGSSHRVSEVIAACGWETGAVSAISGPNLAHEIARGLPAAAVVAGPNEAHTRDWQVALSTPSFRTYRSGDLVGIELAGALKNVVAIAAGAADGLGMGANTIAALVTRGLAEMTRLGVALGAQPLTFQGLAGVGDLAATCFSPLSRNRRLGHHLAKGATLAEAEAEIGEVAEGAATAAVAVALAGRAGVEMPIAEQVDAVLAGRATVASAMASLLGRELREETAGLT